MEPEANDAVPAEAVQAEEVPAEAPAEEAPAEEQPQTEAPEPELYELPDGRKVDGKALYREYAENLLPEFTRRSQELAKFQSQAQQPAPSQQPQGQELPPWEDPAYAPKTVPEFLQMMDMRDQAKAQAQQQALDQAKSSVDAEIASLKAKDPALNEDRLFGHALKYGFRSLVHAHQNMADMGLMARTVAERTQKNLASRAASPIAGNVGGGAAVGEGVDYGSIRAESPKEMLRRISSTQ